MASSAQANDFSLPSFCFFRVDRFVNLYFARIVCVFIIVTLENDGNKKKTINTMLEFQVSSSYADYHLFRCLDRLSR